MVSVVSLLGVDGCEIVAVLERATVVEPVDPLGGGDLEVVEAFPWPTALISSVLYSPMTDLANALSYDERMAPVEGLIPAQERTTWFFCYSPKPT